MGREANWFLARENASVIVAFPCFSTLQTLIEQVSALGPISHLARLETIPSSWIHSYARSGSC